MSIKYYIINGEKYQNLYEVPPEYFKNQFSIERVEKLSSTNLLDKYRHLLTKEQIKNIKD